jgi:hypothetical protein
MTLTEFFHTVEQDTEMRGVDIITGDTPEADALVIEHIPSGYKLRIATQAILMLDYATIKALASGAQRIDRLYHVSRICGYYSRIENWNKSKLGELADRRKGNYTLEAV